MVVKTTAAREPSLRETTQIIVTTTTAPAAVSLIAHWGMSSGDTWSREWLQKRRFIYSAKMRLITAFPPKWNGLKFEILRKEEYQAYQVSMQWLQSMQKGKKQVAHMRMRDMLAHHHSGEWRNPAPRNYSHPSMQALQRVTIQSDSLRRSLCLQQQFRVKNYKWIRNLVIKSEGLSSQDAWTNLQRWRVRHELRKRSHTCNPTMRAMPS